MNTIQEIQDFVGQKTIAVVGVSRDEKSFSAMAFRELKAKGYTVLPVNPNAAAVAGDPCWPSLAALPSVPDGVLVFTPPAATEAVVRDAAARGIRRVWMQQGTVTDAAMAAARESGLSAVAGKCILMFAEPVGSFHAVHRFFAKVFGQVPG